MIKIDVWLYGPLARYGGTAHDPGYAHLELEMAGGSRMRDLLAQLGISDDERGITFINGALAAMPGVPADHDVLLHDGDRVALFHPNSMWPFQYRLGAGTTPQLQQVLQKREDRGVRHAYSQPK